MTPGVPEGYVHGYQAYVCLFGPEEPTPKNVEMLHGRRNELMRRLEEQGIATRQGTHSPVLTGYYAEKYGAAAGRVSQRRSRGTGSRSRSHSFRR